MAALGRFVYAVGGDNNGLPMSSVEKYDVDGNTWSYVASLGTARYGMGVATLNGYIYAAGGWGTGNLQSVERYDATANTWVNVSPLLVGRGGPGATALNGLLYVVGGDGLSSAERYDPTTNTWTYVASLGIVRHSLGVAALNGYIYAAGGKNSADGVVDTCLLYTSPSPRDS